MLLENHVLVKTVGGDIKCCFADFHVDTLHDLVRRVVATENNVLNPYDVDEEGLPSIFYEGHRLDPNATLEQAGINSCSPVVLSAGLRGQGGIWDYMKHVYREVSYFHSPLYGASILGLPLLYNLYGLVKFNFGRIPSTTPQG